MLFNSINFLFFFTVVTTTYFVLPYKYRWALLLAASCFFYMVFIPKYILILFVTIIIDYWAGIKIETSDLKTKKIYLIISIITTCAVLVIFKYFNFFNDNFRNIAELLNLNYPFGLINIILPIGLSFHTFQSLSYVIEVYRGKQVAERNFGIYSLFVMFYPQLVAGPIERPQNLLHQFYEKHQFDPERVVNGLQRMLWGFFKKIVIADNLATYVNQVYGNVDAYSGLTLFTATLFFSIQIYGDFSGYADIAIGSAQIMGFKLNENFKNPYFSLSLSEFWRKWHISLSTWFRDYVYTPLGGNRLGTFRMYSNLFLTFLISGLWHGANWTFVAWGFVHGLFLIFHHILKPLTKKMFPLWFLDEKSVFVRTRKRLIVFMLVLFAWTFFRASNLHDSIYIIKNSIFGLGDLFKNVLLSFVHLNIEYLMKIILPLSEPIYKGNHSNLYLLYFFLLALVLILTDYIDYTKNIFSYIRTQPIYIRWSVYLILCISILNLGIAEEIPFIYFQF